MIPKTTSGSSFHRAGAYFLHDKGAKTAERVAWTETLNLPTRDAHDALAVMRWTVRHADELKRAAGLPRTGRSLESPVLQFSLSWHPEQRPDKAEMMDAARQALAATGIARHQAVLVSHRDEPQPHVHVIVNRVHPDTGRAASDSFIHLKLSKWAEKWEREHGKIYCEERVKNNERRKRGEFAKGRNQVIARAWQQSDNGRSFTAALESEGYILARGDRRDFVIVDRQGKTLNPARQIEGVKVRDIRERLADLTPADLPSVEQARERQRAEGRREETKGEGSDAQRQKAAQKRQAEQARRAEALRRRSEAQQAQRDRQAEFVRDKRQQDSNAPEIWDREAAEIERQKRDTDAAIAAEVERRKAEKLARLRLDPAPQKVLKVSRRKFAEDRAVITASREQFEEWTRRKRGNFRSYHIHEKLDLDQRHRNQIEGQAAELQRHYGQEIKRLEATLREIAARSQQGGFRAMVYRMTGKAAHDRHAEAAARRSLENINWRMAERTEPLKKRQAQEMRDLEQRQQDRMVKLEQRIEILDRRSRNYWRTQPANDRQPDADRPRNLMEQIKRDRAKERERERGPDIGRDRERTRDFER